MRRARAEVCGVGRGAQPAANGQHVSAGGAAFEEVGGAPGGGGDGARPAQHLVGLPPGPAHEAALRPRRQQGEVEHVLWHHVVRGDEANAPRRGFFGEAAPDDDVRLDVDDVGRRVLQHLARVVAGPPGQHEAKPVMRQPAQGGQAVHRHGLALDDLGARVAAPPVLCRGDDVHLVAAFDETRRESLGKPGSTVHVRGEGVATDHDAQAVGRSGLGHVVSSFGLEAPQLRQDSSLRDPS